MNSLSTAVRRPLEFGAGKPYINSAYKQDDSLPNDSVDLNSKVKSMDTSHPCLLAAATETRSGESPVTCWTGGAQDVKSQAAYNSTMWCTGDAAQVKSNLDDGLLFWCTGGASDVKANLDNGLFFWCTGNASDLKSGSPQTKF